MKTWIKMLIAVAVMAMMAACHPDEKNNKKPGGTVSGEPDNSVFLSLNVALPPAGPAAKADGGVGSEQGTEEESKVSTMLVVLADKDNHSYITHGTLVNPTGHEGSVTGVASMDRNGLTKYYAANEDPDPEKKGSLKSGKDLIDVFVFCNYTKELLDAVTKSGQSALAEGADTRTSDDWIHAAGTVKNTIDESIWSNGYFLMSNQSIATRQIPISLAIWNKYGEESSSFNLCGTNGDGDGGINNSATNKRGPITVQRVMARIDLKDASGGETPAWTYPIQTTGSGNGELRVKIERVALVNQSKEFFFLKHVAKPNMTTVDQLIDLKNDSVCGPERGDGLNYSYVVDADVDAEYKKKSQSDEVIDLDATYKAFRYPLFDESGAIDNTVRQQWDAAPTSTFGTAYKAWTYVTENTTPHTSNRAGITTGVVFKGRLVAEQEQNVNEVLVAAANGEYKIPTGRNENEFYLTTVAKGDSRKWPLLYAFGETGRKIYVGWNDQVKTEVKKQMGNNENPSQAEIDALPAGTIAYAYYTPCYKPEGEDAQVSPATMFERLLDVQKNNSDNKQAIDKARDAFKAAAVAAGFTVYQAGLATEDWAFEEGAAGQDDNDAGYFCYYFYWIRHNLAESIGDVYPMEYAVVRNNVYKLSIQSIRRFGHPRLSAHDTDPMTVNTPCEKSELYMTVEVQVADWVTRESSIIL